jgi:hypothetical protein
MDSLNPSLLHTPREADLRLEEYRVLRATIRERGTLRAGLLVAGLCVWAALHLTVQIWLPMPVTSLVPLLVLAAVFEGVFALHVGVERIGRYLEAAYEDTASAGPLWEHTAHAFGKTMTDTAGRLDPLGASLFVLATLLNMVPVLIAAWTPPFVELAVYGGIHLLFIVRIDRGRRFAKRQRGQELEQFARVTKTS